jgi:hypothetical protein
MLPFAVDNAPYVAVPGRAEQLRHAHAQAEEGLNTKRIVAGAPRSWAFPRPPSVSSLRTMGRTCWLRLGTAALVGPSSSVLLVASQHQVLSFVATCTICKLDASLRGTPFRRMRWGWRFCLKSLSLLPWVHYA